MKFSLQQYFLLSLMLMPIFIGCGESSSITAVVNGKEVSFPVDAIDCTTDGFDGSVAGSPGYPTSGRGISVGINYRNANIVDQLRFDIVDMGSVLVGQSVYIDQANIIGTYYFNGILQPASPGLAVIQFNELGLAEGQHIEGDFQVTLPTALLMGHFSCSLRLGFN